MVRTQNCSYSVDDPFKLHFEGNCHSVTYHLHFFAGKTDGAECTSCWTLFIGACARMTLQL